MGLRVCLDARLLSGSSGGVEQLVIGLAGGLTFASKEGHLSLDNKELLLYN